MEALRDEEKVLLAVGGLGAGAVLLYLLARRMQAFGLRFAGFESRAVTSGTTTRRSTGETARDFWFYPLILVTPDVNGDYTVTWNWTETIDGAPTYSSGAITNTFTGLVGGRIVQLRLTDTRPERDPTRGDSIAIGDVDFIAAGIQDGRWHSFTERVSVTVRSPSGATASVEGQLADDFMSIGALSASFAGFEVAKAA